MVAYCFLRFWGRQGVALEGEKIDISMKSLMAEESESLLMGWECWHEIWWYW